MDERQTLDLLYIVAFLLAGVGFSLGPFLAVALLAPRRTRSTRGKTEQLVECGMDPIGDAWIRFGAVYYLYAIMFVAFAVDILFLFPAALVYTLPGVADGLEGFLEILLFVGILGLIIVYAWKKGVFSWERKTLTSR